MPNKKILWSIVIIILIVVAVVFPRQKSNLGPIKIGAVLPLTGPVSGLGESMKKGYEWKAEELNKEGKNVQLIIEDSHSAAKDGLNAFNKLADVDKVPVVFSTMSAVAMTIKPVSEEKGILFWSDAAHPLLTKDSKTILRHSNTSDSDAQTLGDKIIELGKKKTAILYQNDDWGQIASQLLAEKLTKVGIVTIKEPVDNKSGDFRSTLTKNISEKIDSLVTIMAGPASGIIIKQARELGFTGDIVSSVGIILTPDAQKLAGEYLKGTYYQTYSGDEAFIRDYRDKFNAEPAPFSRIPYTDLEIYMSAVEKTGTTSPVVITNYVKNLKEFKGKYETVQITSDGDIIIPTVVKMW